MYVLFQTGPDDFSTYAECYGLNAGPGCEIARSRNLVGLIEHVDKFDHDNWWIRGPGGRQVAMNRRDFYALRSVAAELRKLTKSE